MPRYWLEWTPAGRTQPMREPVEKPRAEAIAYFEAAQRFGGVDRKRFRLKDDAGRVIAGAQEWGTVPRVETTGTLGLE